MLFKGVLDIFAHGEGSYCMSMLTRQNTALMDFSEGTNPKIWENEPWKVMSGCICSETLWDSYGIGLSFHPLVLVHTGQKQVPEIQKIFKKLPVWTDGAHEQ